jgi:hypothetical protein
VIGVDCSADALALATANGAELGLAVEWRLGDLLAPIVEPLDLLVSNPPYLTEAEYATLDASVRDHEPRLALPSGEDGLDAIRRLLDDGRAVVREGGWIALELDCRRAAATAALAEGFGFQGDPSAYRGGVRRGSTSAHLPATAFVNFLQTHDQVGNRAFGERLAALASVEAVAAGLPERVPATVVFVVGGDVADAGVEPHAVVVRSHAGELGAERDQVEGFRTALRVDGDETDQRQHGGRCLGKMRQMRRQPGVQAFSQVHRGFCPGQHFG